MNEKKRIVTMATTIDFAQWQQERVKHFEWVAQTKCPVAGREPRILAGAMRYAVLGGGKRIRPLFAYATGLLSQAKTRTVDAVAFALEAIHSYSLVHDDMPCMDNDTLRRGQPTVHVQYGRAMAMLAGDALQPLAFARIAKVSRDPAIVVRLMQTLTHAAGYLGMCGGQALDLAMVGQTNVDELTLWRMQSMKTGALIRAAVLMGAQSGRAYEAWSERAKSALVIYAQAIGLAFQVVDDILDCTQSTEVLGKTAGKDEDNHKPTWVSILGLDGAKAKAQRLEKEALMALRMLDERLGPQEGTVYLRAIAQIVLQRTH